MRIGIMAPGVNRNDAISNDAAGMYAALKAAGKDVYLVTPDGESDGPYPTWKYIDADWLFSEPDDLLIYHFCTADSAALGTLRGLKCRLALKYHNVTPSRFFEPFSLSHTLACRLGRQMIDHFLKLPIDFVLGDSLFNLSEIIASGFPAKLCRVVPPFHRSEHLLNETEEPATVAHLRQSTTNLLAVGRIVPNKGLDLMIDAMAHLKKTDGPRVDLQIIGGFDDRLTSYTRLLKEKIVSADLEHQVHFHPKTPANALATFYRYCDIFWTASQHEGFCVPVVEAMSFGLPVLATRTTALPETCGDAAVFADSAEEMAEAIRQMVASDDLRRDLARRGLAHVERYSTSATRTAFVEAIDADWFREADHGGSWFGLPDPGWLQALIQEMMPGANLATPGHRRATVGRWLTKAHTHPGAIEYLASPDVLHYADNISAGRLTHRLSGAAKMFWFYSDLARQLFPLDSAEGVANFWRWYMRQTNLAFVPLMSESERRTLIPD